MFSEGSLVSEAMGKPWVLSRVFLADYIIFLTEWIGLARLSANKKFNHSV
jgi:hypothetical protein